MLLVAIQHNNNDNKHGFGRPMDRREKGGGENCALSHAHDNTTRCNMIATGYADCNVL